MSRPTAALVLCLLTHCAVVCARQASSTALPLSDLKSPDAQQRWDTYEKIKADKTALKRSDVKAALVDFLDRENQMMRKTRGVDQDEGYAEDIGELLDTVADIADWHDQRQLCILAESPYSPASEFATNLAVKGGAAAVPCLLKMAQGDWADRSQSIPVLVQLSAVTKNLSPAVREEIQRANILGLRDSNVLVRQSTVAAVGRFGTQEMIPILQDIATSDPVSRRLDNGQLRFSVRDAAAKAIQSIQDRAKTR